MIHGSLFSGYGGLDMAVQEVLGGELAFVCDIDRAAGRVLRHRFPGVPNLKDVTAVDWSRQPRVDVLAGGFPCQDVSTGGHRKGMKEGTRSGLWSQFARAIDELRPGLVFIENVRGLLSAQADGMVEPCPGCVGDGTGEPALRALGGVLGDLAELGFDAEWCGVRASSVAAPHERFRVFVLAWPADSAGERAGAAGAPGDGAGDGPADAGDDLRGAPRRRRPEPAGGAEDPADADGFGGRDEAQGWEPDPDRGDSPDPDADGFPEGALAGSIEAEVGAGDGVDGGRLRGAAPDPDLFELLGGGDPWGRGAGPDDGGGAPAHPDHRAGPADERDHHRNGHQPARSGRRWGDGAWGPYAPAIERWAREVGRPAPVAVAPGTRGQPRLSAHFVEWMMGLPSGWVTDAPGITRADRLKLLGNGVVPQQGAAALRELLRRKELG